jgi:hypothetical protein
MFQSDGLKPALTIVSTIYDVIFHPDELTSAFTIVSIIYDVIFQSDELKSAIPIFSTVYDVMFQSDELKSLHHALSLYTQTTDALIKNFVSSQANQGQYTRESNYTEYDIY